METIEQRLVAVEQERDFYKQRMETDQRMGLAITRERDKLRAQLDTVMRERDAYKANYNAIDISTKLTEFAKGIIGVGLELNQNEIIQLALFHGVIKRVGTLCEFGDCDCMFNCNSTPVYEPVFQDVMYGTSSNTVRTDAPLVANEPNLSDTARKWLHEKSRATKEQADKDLRFWLWSSMVAMLFLAGASYWIKPEGF